MVTLEERIGHTLSPTRLPLPALTGVPVEPTAGARHTTPATPSVTATLSPDRRAASPAKPGAASRVFPRSSQRIGRTGPPGAGVRPVRGEVGGPGASPTGAG